MKTKKAQKRRDTDINPLLNITRRDTSWHGWEFNKNIKNKRTTVFFRDGDYAKSPSASLKAAILYRNNF